MMCPEKRGQPIQLVCALPDDLLQAVRQGLLSVWAASRVLAPLARANTAHAQQLLDAVRREALSTRELKSWFDHYQRSSAAVRARMAQGPRLFLDAVRERQAEHEGQRLRAGPQAVVEKDLRVLLALARRLYRELCARGSSIGCDPNWLHALAQVRQLLEQMRRVLEDDDDTEADPRCGTHPHGAGPQPARDEPTAAPVA